MVRATKIVCLSAGALLMTSSALAEVSSITIRFGGGCTTENDDGGCTIRARASGTDLQSTQLGLERATDELSTGDQDNDDDDDDEDNESIASQYSTADYLPFGRPRTPSANGTASWRFKNDPDPDNCYKARDLRGSAHSNVVCIGDTEENDEDND